VEEIQDLVEKILIEEGHASTAKNYILYRERRSQARSDKNVVVNVNSTISEYLEKLDWRVNANSNQGLQFGRDDFKYFGKSNGNYWLSPYFIRKRVGDAHRKWRLSYSMDLDMFSGILVRGWKFAGFVRGRV